jgi:hypothetical protein
MASLAAASHKKTRLVQVVKTDAMERADRQNGLLLDLIWDRRTRTRTPNGRVILAINSLKFVKIKNNKFRKKNFNIFVEKLKIII